MNVMKQKTNIPIFLDYKKELKKNNWYLTTTFVGKELITPTLVKTVKSNKKKLKHLFIKNEEYLFLSKIIITVLKKTKKNMIFYLNCSENGLVLIKKTLSFLGQGQSNYNNEKQLISFFTQLKMDNKKTYKLSFRQTPEWIQKKTCKFFLSCNTQHKKDLELLYLKIHKANQLTLLWKAYIKFEKSFFITNSQIYQENYTSLAHAASTLIKKKKFKKQKVQDTHKFNKNGFIKLNVQRNGAIQHYDYNSNFANLLGVSQLPVKNTKGVFSTNKWGLLLRNAKNNSFVLSKTKRVKLKYLPELHNTGKPCLVLHKIPFTKGLNFLRKTLFNLLHKKEKSNTPTVYKNMITYYYGLLIRIGNKNAVPKNYKNYAFSIIANSRKCVQKWVEKFPYKIGQYSDTDAILVKGKIPFKSVNKKIPGLLKKNHFGSMFSFLAHPKAYVTLLSYKNKKWFYKKGN